MTGRRLYDIYCDEHRRRSSEEWVGGEWVRRVPALAWPELSRGEREMWTRMAKRIKGVRR